MRSTDHQATRAMYAFDGLPPCARAWLAASPVDFSADEIASFVVPHELSNAAIDAMIDVLERLARTAFATGDICGGAGNQSHKRSFRAQLICDRSVKLPRHFGAIGSEERSPGIGEMIDERPDRDRAWVLGAAACVASALLLDVPFPATA